MRRSEAPEGTSTILVVDDQEDALFGTRRLLERDGHVVLAARSAEIALATVHEHNLHLVLVDYSLPKMSVEQLVREIRKVQPFVQVILLTSSDGEVPPRHLLADLDIQGYHNRADNADKLRLWVAVGLKAHASIRRLREREVQQGRLVAHVSHELRNPINVINGYTELILDGTCGEIPPGAEAPLRALVVTTWKLNQLVDNFLTYAKMEARLIEAELEWVALETIVRELNRTAAIVKNPNVGFSVDSASGPSRVYTDRVKLLAILRNLLTNAAKFTASGSIHLRIAQAGSTIHFSLSDTGIGIAAEEQQAIFEPYRKSQCRPHVPSEGVGLGLTLARRLARLLGGEIRVLSEPGKGSEFALTLRAADGPEVEENELPARRYLKPTEPLTTPV